MTRETIAHILHSNLHLVFLVISLDFFLKLRLCGLKLVFLYITVTADGVYLIFNLTQQCSHTRECCNFKLSLKDNTLCN